jgi:hypothetical protein
MVRRTQVCQKNYELLKTEGHVEDENHLSVHFGKVMDFLIL